MSGNCVLFYYLCFVLVFGLFFCFGLREFETTKVHSFAFLIKALFIASQVFNFTTTPLTATKL